MTATLESLFEIHNGIATTNLIVEEEFFTGAVQFTRPSNSFTGSSAGWIDRASVPSNRIYPPGSLFVSTNGQGSHTYAYVSVAEFACNSDVAVLLPKNEMSIETKIFYAKCITENRWLFSYGRKPKGNRLRGIRLPSDPSMWLQGLTLATAERSAKTRVKPVSLPPVSEWHNFPLTELFRIVKGTRLTKADMLPGETPYLGASVKNNSVTERIDKEPDFPAGTIAVPYNGSVGYATYQPKPYCAGDDVHVLFPCQPISALVAMFVCTMLRNEAFRFHYGYKWNLERMSESTVRLPQSPDGGPDWDLMESYIHSLPLAEVIEQ